MISSVTGVDVAESIEIEVKAKVLSKYFWLFFMSSSLCMDYNHCQNCLEQPTFCAVLFNFHLFPEYNYFRPLSPMLKV